MVREPLGKMFNVLKTYVQIFNYKFKAERINAVKNISKNYYPESLLPSPHNLCTPPQIF